ncbi:hypothetical protein PMAYCL1PPCAC_06066 [Pristionchus mayeri]|uniref:Uncharacterized protein n=1 Tax=Pristionchus mayeri TaxID=1317129 RepID=A0AAN5CC42_9BILA|nr:hypothetical protein PMAYCL1PPCAC_06066 [Pristionchus mayeri]
MRFGRRRGRGRGEGALHGVDSLFLLVHLLTKLSRQICANLKFEELPHFLRILSPVLLGNTHQLVQLSALESLQVQRLLRGYSSDGGLLSDALDSIESLDDPVDHTDVLSVSRPQELALGALAEPVHVVDLRHLSSWLIEVDPVLEILAEVVSHEGTHRHRVVHHLLALVLCSGSGLRFEAGASVDSVKPRIGLHNERNSLGSSSSEDDGIDGYSLRVFPLGMDDGALAGGGGKARIGMSSHSLVSDVPLLAQPCRDIHVLVLHFIFQSLPEVLAISSLGDVREDRVRLKGGHSHRIGLLRSAGSDAEEASLGVDGVQTTVSAELHPCDVVSDAADLPSGQSWLEHREIRLATGRGEGSCDEVLLQAGSSDAHDEHVLGHPSLVLGDVGGNAEGEALLAQKRVASLSRSERPDLSLGRAVGDEDTVGIARPVVDHPLLHGSGQTDGVDAAGEVTVAEDVEDVESHPSHDAHRENHVVGVSQLHSNLRERSSDGAHRERNHVHDAARHASGETRVQLDGEIFGTHPVSHQGLHSLGSAAHSVVLVACHHPRLRLHTSHVLGIGSADVVVVVCLEGGEHSSLHQLVHDLLALVLTSITDVDATGTHQLRLLSHESLHLRRQQMEIALKNGKMAETLDDDLVDDVEGILGDLTERRLACSSVLQGSQEVGIDRHG